MKFNPIKFQCGNTKGQNVLFFFKHFKLLLNQINET